MFPAWCAKLMVCRGKARWDRAVRGLSDRGVWGQVLILDGEAGWKKQRAEG